MAVKTLERLVLINRGIAGLKRIGAHGALMGRTPAMPSLTQQASWSPADYLPAATDTPWASRTGRSASAFLTCVRASRRAIRHPGDWGSGKATRKPIAAERAERLAGGQARRGGQTLPVRRGMSAVSVHRGPMVEAFTASLRERWFGASRVA